MKQFFVLSLAASVAGCVTNPPPQSCPIGGEAGQWQADYCLFSTGTDDLVAAQPCLDREAANQFLDDCAEKRHYKERLCALAIEAGSRSGDIGQCVRDPDFSGPIVRNGGA